MIPILAVMQNQYFHEPAKVKLIIERKPEWRRRLIARFLFAGCHSGRVIKAAFGERINDIIWEEASPEIGGHAASKFPADMVHLRKVVDEVKPRITLAFGVIASNAMAQLVDGFDLVTLPHPAARSADVFDRILHGAQMLERMIKHREAA